MYIFIHNKIFAITNISKNKSAFYYIYCRESEDTMLLILKEIYSNMGVESDRQLPQQTMTIERPVVSNFTKDMKNITE